eukprot:5685563-Pyramimonas_sp.AAC.1
MCKHHNLTRSDAHLPLDRIEGNTSRFHCRVRLHEEDAAPDQRWSRISTTFEQSRTLRIYLRTGCIVQSVPNGVIPGSIWVFAGCKALICRVLRRTLTLTSRCFRCEDHQDCVSCKL